MSINTVQIGVILTQTPRGVKISYRSKGEIYVNVLANEFGGGGHMNAAGAWIDKGDMNKLTEEIISKSEKYLI
jgi:phosphoesterase RecJ-like protein